MVDCVHGIICMYNRKTRDIVLWNPATRQCRLLPKSSNGNPKIRHYHHDFVGLGFDVETKDYKLPLLSTDSWRLLDSDFRTHCCPTLGQSLNGIYFHLGVDYTAEPDKCVILSFDLSKDKYQRVLQIPDGNSPVLQSIGDKLACITTPYEVSGFHKVWMLNDYDTGKEMWTELYRVDATSPKIQTGYSILAIPWNGKLGLFIGGTWVLYNFITDEFEDLGFGEGFCCPTAAIYKESLVSVDAATKAISS
ncbi:F-box/kelch-repeat protein At3g06240-like [Papaver somniferum]|uniref:F-box/kelch-repeat protein At3g06240-like n=1 Tax=Papaver somniferum TaxID=3469 RepID=UPI000E6FCC44|nr:F-box/kelch-repeat protein At3g06240-like [Papaver somniferum]